MCHASISAAARWLLLLLRARQPAALPRLLCLDSSCRPCLLRHCFCHRECRLLAPSCCGTSRLHSLDSWLWRSHSRHSGWH